MRSEDTAAERRQDVAHRVKLFEQAGLIAFFRRFLRPAQIVFDVVSLALGQPSELGQVAPYLVDHGQQRETSRMATAISLSIGGLASVISQGISDCKPFNNAGRP